MKITLLLIAMCFTTMSFADECDDSNGKLEMSIGIYHFKTKELCKEVYNLAKGCELENLNRAKKDNNNYKSIDCAQRILEFFELRKGEINRIGNNFSNEYEWMVLSLKLGIHSYEKIYDTF